jgi:uncharacterized protein (TIGR02996 family)
VRREQLEAQLVANPYDDETYAILADVLQLEGDPRGELIAIDARGDHAARAGLLARHRHLVFRSDWIDLHWHLGFVRRARLHPAPRPHGTALRDPAMRFLAELVCLQGYGRTPSDDLVHVRMVLPTLRALAFGDPDEVVRPSEDEPTDLDGVLDNLERLFSAESITFRRAPRLRDLEVHAVWPQTIGWLARADMPALERLAVHVQNAIDPIAFLAAVPPTVTVLELAGPEIGDRFLRAIATSPLLPRLRSLRLWNADVTLEGARHVTREAFGHLELLDLSDPFLDDATIARLAGACREVRTLSPLVRSLFRRE